MKNLPKKISSKNLVIGILFGVACLVGCFLDSDGEAGWMALGVCLLCAVAFVVLMFRWDKKMEGDDNDN